MLLLIEILPSFPWSIGLRIYHCIDIIIGNGRIRGAGPKADQIFRELESTLQEEIQSMVGFGQYQDWFDAIRVQDTSEALRENTLAGLENSDQPSTLDAAHC